MGPLRRVVRRCPSDWQQIPCVISLIFSIFFVAVNVVCVVAVVVVVDDVVVVTVVAAVAAASFFVVVYLGGRPRLKIMKGGRIILMDLIKS